MKRTKNILGIMRVVVMLCALLSFWASARAGDGAGVPLEIKVASYNLRMDTDNDGLDAWAYRVDRVVDLIRYHKFDIFGTQEGFAHQLQDLLEMGEYAYTGVGRDDGRDAGEHSAIFYRKECFDLEESGDFWLSQTPDTPSKGWDATCCHRICSWGCFRDLESGAVFYFFNVHYDHEGQQARRESSRLLLERIKEIAHEYPVILTGDFNATPESEPISLLREDSLLLDTYEASIAKPYGTVGTYNGFRMDHPMSDRIDYIWVTRHFVVHDYATLNEQQYGRFPSDHFPVLVTLSLSVVPK